MLGKQTAQTEPRKKNMRLLNKRLLLVGSLLFKSGCLVALLTLEFLIVKGLMDYVDLLP